MHSRNLTNYTRWVTASIMKWMDGRRQDVTLHVEGTEKKTQTEKQRLELRIDGPHQRPSGTANEITLKVSINILASTVYDEKDIYHLEKLLGIASQMLNSAIPVYQLPATTLIGCLQMCDDPGIEVHAFGQADSTTKLWQGSAEASYELYL